MTFVEWFTSLTTAAQWAVGLSFIGGIVLFCWLLLAIDRAYQRSQDRANAAVLEVPLPPVDVPRLRLAAGYDATTGEVAKVVDPWADAEDPWTTFTPGGRS
jgi:hypothetical protein